MMKAVCVSLIFACLCSCCMTVEPVMPVDLFKKGDLGYASFRIPSIIAAGDGTLLAFAEGRVKGQGDTGDINLVQRRSEDGGHTWSPIEVIWDDKENVCGNPCPVVLDNGDILLLLTWNSGKEPEHLIKKGHSKFGRIPYVKKSSDNGKTWTEALDISSMADKEEWLWYATGPGNGIQLQHGKFKGRIVVPCANSTLKGGYNSHVIYSDDDGKTWKYSGDIGPGTNESCVAELPDGTLIFNSRQQTNKSGFRGQAISRDGGTTWENYSNKTSLKEPTCQASFISYGDSLLFMNPQGKGRSDGVIQRSDDNGQSWRKVYELPKGSFAYSSMTVLSNNSVAVLYEKDNYQKIYFQVIPAAELK